MAPCGGVQEAPNELAALSGPTSPILELIGVISHNTAVDNSDIKSVFQPAQWLVDPNATDRLIGAGNNGDYIKALGALELSLEQALAQSTQLATDSATFAPVLTSVFAAKGEVQRVAGSFSIDKQTHTNGLIVDLISQPIDCIAMLQPSPGAPANGGGAKICSAIDPLLGKFPFSNNAQIQASLSEVDNAFAPETGVLWTTYATALKPFIVQTGPQLGAPYAQAPSPPQAVNPRFVTYFNRAAHVSNVLYGSGQKTAAFSFTLRFIPGNGVSNASLVVDGQKIQSGLSPQQFTWNGRNAQNTSLIYDNNETLPFQGPWSLFQMIRTAQISRSGVGYKLEYPINTSTTIAGHKVGGTTSSSKIATFELSGAGAELLVPDGFSGLSCVRPVAK